jgi:hypothetical protein
MILHRRNIGRARGSGGSRRAEEIVTTVRAPGQERATFGAPGQPSDTRRLARSNIIPTDLGQLAWRSPDEVEGSISAAYAYAEARALEAINWYLREKRPNAVGSRVLRFLAIVLATLGGLAPIIASVGWLSARYAVNLGQLGYVLLGLAAACVGLDKLFGYSSAWMRYMMSALVLQRALSEFRLDWAMMIAKLKGQSPTTDQIQLMLQRLKEFVVLVDTEVERETQTWIAEFQSNLAEIERTAKAQVETSRPGAIDITVTNGMDTADGVTISLDGMVVKTVRGTKYQIGYVPPGPHKVSVTGTIDGKPLDASELVNVPPGVIAKVAMALPVEEAQP